jgi:hypothetical protein
MQEDLNGLLRPDLFDNPINTCIVSYQFCFFRLWQLLNLPFDSQRQASAPYILLKNQHQRPPAPKVLSPFITVSLVLRKPAGNIGRNAGIQTSIAAPDQVYVPIQHNLCY